MLFLSNNVSEKKKDFPLGKLFVTFIPIPIQM